MPRVWFSKSPASPRDRAPYHPLSPDDDAAASPFSSSAVCRARYVRICAAEAAAAAS